jgi:hypothetical protein
MRGAVFGDLWAAKFLERAMGIEPTTSSLGSLRSTTELRPRRLKPALEFVSAHESQALRKGVKCLESFSPCFWQHMPWLFPYPGISTGRRPPYAQKLGIAISHIVEKTRSKWFRSLWGRDYD